MIVCIAKSHQEFDQWIRDNFRYVGDRWQLEAIDPKQVDRIELIGEHFRDHPIYFSDEFLEFQLKVAFSRGSLDKGSWLDRLLRRIHG